ncbi:MAG: polysaccharide deacetylase family protein [Candidatus Hydrogenedentes bacterium]|nr:polysaccharide deacetylase family protein [Candidatus Hydrogenedentota bacterium]
MMIKQPIKRAVKRALMGAGMLLPHAAACSRILTYHSVGTRDHEMNVTPKCFCEQMEWLAAECTVITLAEAAQGHAGVAVTFDDGYRDNLTEAAPILRRLGIPATLFAVAGRLGAFLDHDAKREDARLLSWDELREFASQGFEVGGHGMSHARLSSLDESQQRAEITGSLDRLREELQCSVLSFAYPYGTAADYNATSLRIAQECGCAYACSNRYGVNRPGSLETFALRRTWIDRSDTLPIFRAKVLGKLDLLSALEGPAGLRARKWLNRISGR